MIRTSIIALLTINSVQFAVGLSVTLNSVDNGWYADEITPYLGVPTPGFHMPSNANTYTGFNGSSYNSFFNFDTSALVGYNITSATVRFFGNNGRYYSDDTFETLQLWDVSTTPGLGSSLAVYSDLMSGVLYGQVDVAGTKDQSMPEITMDLSPNSFADISNNGFFSLGGHLATVQGSEWQVLWYSSTSLPAAELTVHYTSSVPDSGSTALLLGTCLLGLATSRRKNCRN